MINEAQCLERTKEENLLYDTWVGWISFSASKWLTFSSLRCSCARPELLLPPPLAPVDLFQLGLRVRRQLHFTFPCFSAAVNLQCRRSVGSIDRIRFSCKVSTPALASALHHRPSEPRRFFFFVPLGCSDDFVSSLFEVFILLFFWLFLAALKKVPVMSWLIR